MYLLLRDNKQSGPYSLDDLRTKGLKAYDLVWVEGKSAAWRYPSEINELIPFAPMVEEQPFDRFYKKPAAVAVGSGVSSGVGSGIASGVAAGVGSGATSNAAVAYQPLYSEEQAPATRKRTIYVTMPGAAAAPVTVRETIRTAPAVRPVAAALPIEDYTFSEPVSRLDNSRDYNNGELMPRSRSRNKPAILQPILIGVGVLVLLAGGIFIGLSINKDNPVLQKLASTHSTATPLPVPSAVSPAVTATQPQSTNPTATTQDRDHAGAGAASPPGSTAGSIPVSGPVSPSVSTPTTQTLAAKTGKAVQPRQKAIMPASQALPLTTTNDSSSAAGGVVAVHREAVHRTDLPNTDAADKGSLKVNLASQVAIGANRYEVGTFGGISNLQVTVSNKSPYPLDLVVVEVQYIQANKKTYRTENLYFHSVGPGITLMQEAPKSSRGIKVAYKITQISSKELGVSESGL
jgi:hypothetical protein